MLLLHHPFFILKFNQWPYHPQFHKSETWVPLSLPSSSETGLPSIRISRCLLIMIWSCPLSNQFTCPCLDLFQCVSDNESTSGSLPPSVSLPLSPRTAMYIIRMFHLKFWLSSVTVLPTTRSGPENLTVPNQPASLPASPFQITLGFPVPGNSLHLSPTLRYFTPR